MKSKNWKFNKYTSFHNTEIGNVSLKHWIWQQVCVCVQSNQELIPSHSFSVCFEFGQSSYVTCISKICMPISVVANESDKNKRNNNSNTLYAHLDFVQLIHYSCEVARFDSGTIYSCCCCYCCWYFVVLNFRFVNSVNEIEIEIEIGIRFMCVHERVKRVYTLLFKWLEAKLCVAKRPI